MHEKRNNKFITSKRYIKNLIVTLKHVTKSLQIFADIETPTQFRRDDYTITKITINKGQTNTEKKSD